MVKCTQLLPFVKDLFDEPTQAWKAARIIGGILKGRSPRLSDISRAMEGNEIANYKCIQRFLETQDVSRVLPCLFREEAPFLIGDPTEIPRPQAKKTDYVGTLSDGETQGYWLLLLATPYHGRAMPCASVDYSSRTINQDATSRNLHYFAASAPAAGRWRWRRPWGRVRRHRGYNTIPASCLSARRRDGLEDAGLRNSIRTLAL